MVKGKLCSNVKKNIDDYNSFLLIIYSGRNNMHDENDLQEVLKELISPIISPFINFYCDKCSSSLEDYDVEPLIFGKDSFIDLLLCSKCAADYFAEKDYHSEEIRDESENVISEPIFEETQTYEIQKKTHKVLESLALGMTERDILEKYLLSRRDLLACYKFAAQRI